MNLKKFVYGLYKKTNNSKIICTAAFFLYSMLSGFKNKNCRVSNKKGERKYIKDIKTPVLKKDVKVAFICDDMTYKCFSQECDARFVTPNNWHNIFDEFMPDIFFCESAWSGIKEYGECWRGKIYKNNNVLFETRKVLFGILDYCKRHNIKTVFWNKEDPTYFGNDKYDFVDTALKFDYIFTTCAECVERYKKLGKNNTEVLMFGFTPKFFNPMNSFPKENFAVFAGSWYNNEKERCMDMENLFDNILNKNINLKIYDRYFNSNNVNTVFPQKYSLFNKGSIPFDKLGREIKKAKYAVNINTVKNSDTMFARRVFELMACNTVVISNYSKGMKKMFENNVWFLGENFEYSEKLLEDNLYNVLKNHTNEIRFKSILRRIGFSVILEEFSIAVIYFESADFSIKRHFENLNFEKKRGFILKEKNLCEIGSDHSISIMELKRLFSHFIFFSYDAGFDFEKAFLHYSYIDNMTGIRFFENGISQKYTISADCKNENTLFPVLLIDFILKDFHSKLKKYVI